jgi:hypothetical protein
MTCWWLFLKIKVTHLRATAEDSTKSTTLWLGMGDQVSAPDSCQSLKYFEGMKMMNDMMKMNGEYE